MNDYLMRLSSQEYARELEERIATLEADNERLEKELAKKDTRISALDDVIAMERGHTWAQLRQSDAKRDEWKRKFEEQQAALSVPESYYGVVSDAVAEELERTKAERDEYRHRLDQATSYAADKARLEEENINLRTTLSRYGTCPVCGNLYVMSRDTAVELESRAKQAEAERDALRDDLAEIKENARKCSTCPENFDGGFFWPERCLLEDRLKVALKESETMRSDIYLELAGLRAYRKEIQKAIKARAALASESRLQSGGGE